MVDPRFIGHVDNDDNDYYVDNDENADDIDDHNDDHNDNSKDDNDDSVEQRRPWYGEQAEVWIQATPGSGGPDGIPEPDDDDDSNVND